MAFLFKSSLNKCSKFQSNGDSGATNGEKSKKVDDGSIVRISTRQWAIDSGYDAKMMRKIVAMRRVDKAKRDEEEAILELYLAALEME